MSSLHVSKNFCALQTNILYVKCFRITVLMQHILHQTAYTGVVKVTSDGHSFLEHYGRCG